MSELPSLQLASAWLQVGQSAFKTPEALASASWLVVAVWWGPCRLACTLWVPACVVAGGLEVLEVVAVCGPTALQVEGELAGLEPRGRLQQPCRSPL